MIELHQLAAAIYLAAGLGSVLGLVLPAPRISRGAVWGLLIGAVVHGAAFATLHMLEPPPPLTALPAALSLTAWSSVIFLLFLMWRLRIPAVAAVVGPVAFLTVFLSSHRLPGSGLAAANASPVISATGTWPHAHVLLASAGLALLGVAGLAGLFFLIEHRRLKSKRGLRRSAQLPSLEALDRINVVALAIGFPLLTLGVVTGMFWLQAATGSRFSGSHHETWSAIAWTIYAGLALARFVAHQGARQAAASAVAGFAFLVFAVVGIGMIE